jgi:hypothetical protein
MLSGEEVSQVQEGSVEEEIAGEFGMTLRDRSPIPEEEEIGPTPDKGRGLDGGTGSRQ